MSLLANFKMDTREINTTGSATGSDDRKRFGNSESFLSTMLFRSLVDAPGVSRIGMLNLESNFRARKSTKIAGRMLAERPAIMAKPKSSLRPLAIINGPGVGGTIEWVIAPAPAIAMTYNV